LDLTRLAIPNQVGLGRQIYYGPCRAKASPQTDAAPATFSFSSHADMVFPVVITMSDSTNPIAAFSWTGVHRREQWPGIATLLVGGGAEAHPNSKAMLADLIVAQAHRAVDQDIMVTTSPCLLQRRTDASVSETNPRLPSETAQIVGLCLRTRNNDATNCGH